MPIRSPIMKMREQVSRHSNHQFKTHEKFNMGPESLPSLNHAEANRNRET